MHWDEPYLKSPWWRHHRLYGSLITDENTMFPLITRSFPSRSWWNFIGLISVCNIWFLVQHCTLPRGCAVPRTALVVKWLSAVAFSLAKSVLAVYMPQYCLLVQRLVCWFNVLKTFMHQHSCKMLCWATNIVLTFVTSGSLVVNKSEYFSNTTIRLRAKVRINHSSSWIG